MVRMLRELSNVEIIRVEGGREMPYEITFRDKVVCSTFTHFHAKHIARALVMHPFESVPPVPEYDPDLDDIVVR